MLKSLAVPSVASPHSKAQGRAVISRDNSSKHEMTIRMCRKQQVWQAASLAEQGMPELKHKMEIHRKWKRGWTKEEYGKHYLNLKG